MLLVKNGRAVPEDWKHPPEFQNENGETLAMYISKFSIPIPEEWRHKPEM